MKIDRAKITDEIIAAFLEGNATAAEAALVVYAAKRDKRLMEYLTLAAPQPMVIPMHAQAATGEQDNLCNIRCEQYVLQKFGIIVSEEELVRKAMASQWLKEGGTPLFQMGNICAGYALSVARQYDAALEDIKTALTQGYEVIVAVDGGEIDGELEEEALEDTLIGKIPDHSIVVLSIDGNEVVCYNPFHGEAPQIIPLERFIDAWEDSNYYMIKISTKANVATKYKPAPLDLSDVCLPGSLTELTEAIAENIHEVWSAGRMKEGWTYGVERNDKLKKHPDLVPYSNLPDSEKQYDRETAMNTIKLVIKLGYGLVKKPIQ